MLSQSLIHEVYEAAVACGFDHEIQNALIAALPTSCQMMLPGSDRPAARLSHTLSVLNRADPLADGSLPLSVWLQGAIDMYGERAEARAFRRAIAELTRGPLVQLRVVGTPFAYQAAPGSDTLSVGRQRRKPSGSLQEGNDVVIRVEGSEADSLRISRHHFEIKRGASSHVIIDRSRGRTALNERVLPVGEPVPLRSGDRIGIAGVLVIEFMLREASPDVIAGGRVPVGEAPSGAGGVVLEASIGDMVTVRDD